MTWLYKTWVDLCLVSRSKTAGSSLFHHPVSPPQPSPIAQLPQRSREIPVAKRCSKQNLNRIWKDPIYPSRTIRKRNKKHHHLDRKTTNQQSSSCFSKHWFPVEGFSPLVLHPICQRSTWGAPKKNGPNSPGWWLHQPHLNNISQNGNLPQVGVKISKKKWNHHLVNLFPLQHGFLPGSFWSRWWCQVTYVTSQVWFLHLLGKFT